LASLEVKVLTPLEPKKRLPPSPTPPTAAPPETGEVKKTNLKLPEEFLWKKV